MTTYQNALEGVELIALHIRAWTGRKKLRAEDLTLGDGGKLPSDELISLGIKKVIDTKRLNPFERLRKQSERLCEQYGVRFLGGYALPKERCGEISVQLEQIKLEFQDEIRSFLAEYSQETSSWCAKHPEFEAALRRAIPSLNDVTHRFSFEFSIFKVGVAETDSDLDKQTHRLGDQLFKEVSTHASLILENIQKAKTVSRRAFGPLKAIKEKLVGLAFLDPAASSMAKTIDDLLQEIDGAKKIEGILYHKALSTVLILSDPDKIKDHAQGLLSVTAMAFESAGEHDLALLGDEGQITDASKDDLNDDLGFSSPSASTQIKPTQEATRIAGEPFFSFDDEPQEITKEAAEVVAALSAMIQEDIKGSKTTEVSEEEAETIFKNDEDENLDIGDAFMSGFADFLKPEGGKDEINVRTENFSETPVSTSNSQFMDF